MSMNVALLYAAVLLATVSVASAGACAAQKDCKSCLGTPFCGWCSPAPTVFDNGTLGSQCQDQHEFGWHCNHLFSTSQCLVGYVCGTDGKCSPDPAGGTGDTKENCERTCKKPPTGLSTCDVKSSTCVPCQDYCKKDEDCPDSYCQSGLCHGSTCQSNTTCSSTCSADTPDILIGTWRGVQIQSGFQKGEFDMKFQKKAAGPQVMYRGPSDAVSSGSLTADAASGGRHLTLQFTTGPLAKTVLNGAYDAWEPSPETESMAFYFGAPSDEAPKDIHVAINGTGRTVYSLQKCSGHAAKCDFDSVFPAVQSLVFAGAGLNGDLVHDPCNTNANCGSCIGDASGLCGWCSQNVEYSDGTPGAQCAGFDKSGKALGWQCHGVFSKTDCADYGCDFTDIKNPKCVAGNGTHTKEECADLCKAPEAQYTCDDSTKTCKECDMHYCTDDKQCPGSYCNKHGDGPWSCHGLVPAGCTDKAKCDTGCNTTETYAVCDHYAGTCTPVPASHPNATTKYECEHHCTGSKPTGTYRAVAINKGFVRGEYDFTFYDDDTMHWRSPDGKTAVAALTAGSETVESDAVAIDGTVTKADDASIVGKKIFAIFKRDDQGNDGIGKMLFNGFDFAPVSTYDGAMDKTMWVMLGCKDDECDFSSVLVH